jgi:hypothetical protein
MKKATKVRLKLLKYARSRDTARCIFCGKHETTKEHVYPKWSHPYLLPRTKSQNRITISIRYPDRIEAAAFKMPPLRDWQIKCVCGDCNNGWMSILEKRLKPIMIPLMRGRKTHLSDSKLEAIATWAILKVMVTMNRSCKAAQRREMKKKQKPLDFWAVFIGTYNRKKWMQEWGSTPFRLDPDFKFAPGRTKRRRGWPANAHATTQILNKLFIHVIHGPDHGIVDGWKFTPPRARLSGNLIKIWPPTGVGVREHWPQARLTDADAFAATYTLQALLMHLAEQVGLAVPLSKL